MPDRYYSAEPIQGPTITLSGSEAHHLLHVMRARPGLELVLFDGQGGEYDAEVAHCGRSTVDVAIASRRDVEREHPHGLTLAVALPKGDRQRWLIEKAVELGVKRLIPLQTTRSVVCREEVSSKLLRTIIEASKQCGRNRLMELAKPAKLAEFLKSENAACRLLAHPGSRRLTELEWGAAGDRCLVVGPEGGFTEEEVAEAVEAGWETVDLGGRILRIETAAIALLSAVTLR